jgi:predicted CXXCH cytochrome family protein
MKKAPIISAIFLMSALIVLLSTRLSPALVDHSQYETVAECLECHMLSPPSHRQNTPTRMTEDWPLDPQGRLLCITCHKCITGSCVLRKESPALCQVCHDCTQGMGCLISSAHMGGSPDIDTLLRDCILCHDGVTAKNSTGPGNHRIDVIYIQNEYYKDVTDRRVVLVDGKVTCVSCHNPYKSEAARLSISNHGSKLCLTCHRR